MTLFPLSLLATKTQRWRAALLLTAFLLTGWLLWESLWLGYEQDHSAITLAWLLASVAYFVAMTPAVRAPRDWSVWRRTHARATLVLIGITLIAFVLRAWSLDTIPFALSGDEASFGLEAVRVLRGAISTPFATGFLSQPTMSFFYGSLGVRFFGATILGARAPWMLLGTLTIPVIFWIAKRSAGVYVAFVTAALLATYHFHIHYARLSLNNIADPLIVGLALLFLDRALMRRRPLDWALLGAMCGLSLYGYQGARLTSPVIGATILYRFAYDRLREWRARSVGLLIALGAFLIVAAPMLQYAAFFPDEFNARVNQMGILQSGLLDQTVQQTETNAWLVLFDQFRRAALAFNFYPDRVVWYGLPTPLLDPIFGVVFLLGLGYATVRALLPPANRRWFPFVAWWWGGTILGGALTESPPSTMRLVTLTAPTCFFIAIGMLQIVNLARKAFAAFPVRIVLVAIVTLFAWISLQTYFVDYTPRRIYGSVRAETATRIAPTLRALSATHRFYFLGAPFMYWGFATFPFLVPNADAHDVNEPIQSPVPRAWVTPGQGAVFIALPERMHELQFVQTTWQNGERIEFISPVGGYFSAVLYVVPP